MAAQFLHSSWIIDRSEDDVVRPHYRSEGKQSETPRETSLESREFSTKKQEAPVSPILELGFKMSMIIMRALERGNSSCNEQQVQGLCTLCCTNSLLGNHHLVVVERFVCSYEPGGYVVWGLVHLVGSLKENWSQVRGQSKNVSKKTRSLFRT